MTLKSCAASLLAFLVLCRDRLAWCKSVKFPIPYKICVRILASGHRTPCQSLQVPNQRLFAHDIVRAIDADKARMGARHDRQAKLSDTNNYFARKTHTSASSTSSLWSPTSCKQRMATFAECWPHSGLARSGYSY